MIFGLPAERHKMTPLLHHALNLPLERTGCINAPPNHSLTALIEVSIVLKLQFNSLNNTGNFQKIVNCY